MCTGYVEHRNRIAGSDYCTRAEKLASDELFGFELEANVNGQTDAYIRQYGCPLML